MVSKEGESIPFAETIHPDKVGCVEERFYPHHHFQLRCPAHMMMILPVLKSVCILAMIICST